VRRCCLLVTCLLLVGCGDLDTTYAARDAGSVNGIAVFAELVERRLDPGQRFRLGGEGHKLVTMLHVATDPNRIDAEAMHHIDDWLYERDGRQFLLVLRDGAVAGWLLSRWIDEADAAAPKADQRTREVLRRQQELWRKRRAEEFEPPPVSAGTSWSYDGWEVVGTRPLEPDSLDGLSPGPAPPMMRMRCTV